MAKPDSPRRQLLSLCTLPMLIGLALLAAACRPADPVEATVQEGIALLESIYSRLDAIEEASPQLAFVDTPGTSETPPEGSPRCMEETWPIRRIVLRGTRFQPGGPRLLITGAFHGNEPLSAEIALRLAEFVAGAYLDDNFPEVRNLLDDVELQIIPVVNPWGLVHHERFTAAGIDLNRDFGSPEPDEDELENYELDPDWLHPWVTGFAAAESRLLRELCREERYLAAVHGHTGAEYICLPMDYLPYFEQDSVPEEGDPAFLDEYIPIYPLLAPYAEAYAAALRGKGYPQFEAIEGADWYVVSGSFSDWHFGALGAPGLTVEYDSRKKRLSPAELDSAWLAHREALIELLGFSRHRVEGIVPEADQERALTRITFTRAPAGRELGAPTPLTLTAVIDPDALRYQILVPEGEWLAAGVRADGTGVELGTVTVASPAVPVRFDPQPSL